MTELQQQDRVKCPDIQDPSDPGSSIQQHGIVRQVHGNYVLVAMLDENLNIGKESQYYADQLEMVRRPL
tara:strand:+ start:11020 stop:11226 length:207 start_codon:yes stop_codon:yes gene_type:complete